MRLTREDLTGVLLLYVCASLYGKISFALENSLCPLCPAKISLTNFNMLSNHPEPFYLPLYCGIGCDELRGRIILLCVVAQVVFGLFK